MRKTGLHALHVHRIRRVPVAKSSALTPDVLAPVHGIQAR